MADAARLAGLNAVRVFNESSAVVMNYSLFRKNQMDAASRLVVFADLGQSKASLVAATINQDRAEIILEMNDRDLGVRDMDLQVVRHYIQKYQSETGVDLSGNSRSVWRLMGGVEKQRKVLSSIKEAKIALEYIHEENDLNYTLTRDDFEKIIHN